jgi:hypothetical protein
MIPYALGMKPWPFEQITPFSWGSMYELFRRASIEYDDENYEEMIGQLPDINTDDILNLLYPKKFNIS